MTDEAESKTKWVILKGINYEDDIYVQKTLASRIFTIQFSDADLFAVHAVYGKAFQSISSVRLWSKMLRLV